MLGVIFILLIIVLFIVLGQAISDDAPFFVIVFGIIMILLMIGVMSLVMDWFPVIFG